MSNNSVIENIQSLRLLLKGLKNYCDSFDQSYSFILVSASAIIGKLEKDFLLEDTGELARMALGQYYRLRRDPPTPKDNLKERKECAVALENFIKQLEKKITESTN